MTFFGRDALKMAHEIRLRVARTVGVTISVGVSWNKIFAKLGSDYKKPNAVTEIARGNVCEIVWPLPVSDLLLVGRNTAQELGKYGIHTIGALANADEAFLLRQFGKLGGQLHINACGLDASPVARTGECAPAKSIGNGMTFRRDLCGESDIRVALTALADSVASRMRRAGVECATVQVTLKDPTLKSVTRQKAVPPTRLAADLARACLELIRAGWPEGKPIRTLTVTAQHLLPAGEAPGQISLFDAPGDSLKAERLEEAVDHVRGRYGGKSIQHGSVMGNDLGI